MPDPHQLEYKQQPQQRQRQLQQKHFINNNWIINFIESYIFSIIYEKLFHRGYLICVAGFTVTCKDGSGKVIFFFIEI